MSAPQPYTAPRTQAQTDPTLASDMPTFTLNRHVAEVRARVGEARWAELNREWEA